MMKLIVVAAVVTTVTSYAPKAETVSRRRPSELWDRKTVEANGIKWRGNFTVSPLKHLEESVDLPLDFSWFVRLRLILTSLARECDKDGVNYCTMSRNQHIPQVQRGDEWPIGK
eukprot:2609319-Pleurochrysis_carterae.AAC.1